MYTTIMQNYKCIAWQDDDTVTESSYFVQKLVLFGKLRYVRWVLEDYAQIQGSY